MSRRIGRILAFQALYSWNAAQIAPEDLLAFSWLEPVEGDSEDESAIFREQLNRFNVLDAQKREETFAFARLLVNGTLAHINEIDDTIRAHLSKSWRLERINKVALAVMRFSIYTILYQQDTPVSIVIDEAVEIIKDYGAEDSYKFVNAILDKISKETAAAKNSADS